MTDTGSAPKKIVIVGAGVAGLSTAFNLTDPDVNPDWRDRYSVDVYQLGWRVGGKCATGRNPDACERIQEHGIHIFANFYFNALRMVKTVFAEVEWDEHDKHRTMEEAFLPSAVVYNTDYFDKQWHGFLSRFPLSDGVPWEGPPSADTRQLMQNALSLIDHHLAVALERKEQGTGPIWERAWRWIEGVIGDELNKVAERVVEHLIAEQHDPQDPGHGRHSLVMHLLDDVVAVLRRHQERHPHDAEFREIFVQVDLIATAIRGLIADDVLARGIDSIDGVNYRDWLEWHGASEITLQSSAPQAIPNTALAYEYGDTTAIPTMSAAAWMTFLLRQMSGKGAFAYYFAEGTGETFVKPLYRALEQRGVRFHFFHKLREVVPDPTEPVVQRLEFDVQATVKPADVPYQPLRRLPDGELVWPDRPNYEQLVEGPELEERGIDLESWWTPWEPVRSETLEVGTDFDQVVLATPISTLQYTCGPLIEHPRAKDAWEPMVKNLKSSATQAVQIWLNATTEELGWKKTITDLPTNRFVGGTYGQDLTDSCDFSDLIAMERWPEHNTPHGLVYFIGALPDPEEIPPFTDHDYPVRQGARVKWSAIQYLRTIDGLLPGAPRSPIDARSFDFDLLAAHDPATRGRGVNQFDQQYWRANIDPNERFTLNVADTVRHRLDPWDSKFDNLVLAGDWTYTGFNLGSFEGATMSGKLASLALTGAPALDDVYGYAFLHPNRTGPSRIRLREGAGEES
jgi:uncharacterized protein with NAD-binding domain and iron-sulfur cluster